MPNFRNGRLSEDIKREISALIREAYASVSDICIIQMQDLLCLDNSARMNIPSTIGGGNWAWRLSGGECTPRLAKRLKKLAKTYYRAG